MGYMMSGYDPPGGGTESEPKKLRKGIFSKIVLGLVIGTVLVYTAAVLLVTVLGGAVPDSLTYCFFAFFGTEIISLVTIRVSKLKGERDYAAFGEPERDFGKNPSEPEAYATDADGAETDPPHEE